MKNSARSVVKNPWNEDCDLPLLIEDGPYEACYTNHNFCQIFDKHRIVMEFRITSAGPFFGVILNHYSVVQQASKNRWIPARNSNLAKSIVRLFPSFRGQRKFVQRDLSALFANKIFLVEVSTVQTDYKQRKLDNPYSKIAEVVRILEGE